MAEAIRELILSGELESGATLPIEPELAGQFGVSRAVVRDATRILMAQGLVEVRQGLGVFVTQPQNEAFGQALLLALRRAGASVWDVEQFEQVIFPEVIALAAAQATDEEVVEIERLAAAYLDFFARHQAIWGDKEEETPAVELERLMASYRPVMGAIFAATHNRVLQQLAQPLLKLRNLRNWRGDESSPETAIKIEADFMHQLIEAIAARDPAQARVSMSRLMSLPDEAIEVMRQTPVGEIPVIPAAYYPRWPGQA